MSVFSVDDPMLALIARFAACCNEPAVSEEAFLRQQCDAMREYVTKGPDDRRQERALEWVMRNAEDYRRKWHEQVVAQEAPGSRCPDCPLIRRTETVNCEIHERWLELLEGYMAGERSSRDYVMDTLSLLRAHKEHLKQRGRQIADR